MPPKKKPTPHPEPPPDLHSRPLLLRPRRTGWFRIHDLNFDPLYFGRTGNHRFDAPHPRRYGVLSVGGNIDCAFIETLGHETGKNLNEPLNPWNGLPLPAATKRRRLTMAWPVPSATLAFDPARALQ